MSFNKIVLHQFPNDSSSTTVKTLHNCPYCRCSPYHINNR